MRLPSILARLAALVLMSVTLPAVAQAQTATVEWSDFGAAPLSPVPNPGTVTASDGTTVTVNYSLLTNGGFVQPGWGGGYVLYYNGNIGGVSPSLLMNMDNSAYDPGDKVVLDIALDRQATNLRFTVSDVDRATFQDSVEVFYDTGDGIWRNAADTAAFWSLGGMDVTRRNNGVMNGWTGTGSAANNSPSANVDFNFGNTGVTRVRIRFFSYSGWGNPDRSFVAVSRLQFDDRSPTDLSLNKQLLTANPPPGSSATFRLTVSNAATARQTATGVQVRDLLPAGFQFTSATGTGSYSAATGIWNVGSVAPGASVSLDITGTVNATPGATIVNSAEIIASDQEDRDSTPGNGVTTEDDYDSATLNVGGNRVAGTPPELSCSAGALTFDWTGNNWPAGSTFNSYNLAGLGNIQFTMALPAGGQWLNIGAFGGQSPVRQGSVHGGTNDLAVVQAVDLANRDDEVVTTINLPAVIQGAQFGLFDVDFGPNQFADKVTVEGRLNGLTVLPTLTNGTANYVIGNIAYGDQASNNNEAAGNVVVTFDEAIDTIIIRYGDHSTAPFNPGNQAIAIHDIAFCAPTTTLAVSKTSSVISDPVSGTDNPKAIPGAVVRYCIEITNEGSVSATAVNAIDFLPAGTSYVSSSLVSGTSCSATSQAEDDDASGADETDPFGASFAGGQVQAQASTLAPGASFAVAFRATVE